MAENCVWEYFFNILTLKILLEMLSKLTIQFSLFIIHQTCSIWLWNVFYKTYGNLFTVSCRVCVCWEGIELCLLKRLADISYNSSVRNLIVSMTFDCCTNNASSLCLTGCEIITNNYQIYNRMTLFVSINVNTYTFNWHIYIMLVILVYSIHLLWLDTIYNKT